MATASDYVDWRGDLSFEVSPVNEVDEFIFACIGKPDFTGIVPPDSCSVSLASAVNAYFAMHGDESLGLVASTQILPVLRKLAVSERYRNIRLSGFVNKVIPSLTEQFSALTVHSPDGINYVSFRGTDDTLIAWKENCELAVREYVPAQRDALAYLEWAADVYEGPIVVCGHSKGGNLAMYAACMAPAYVQDRIIEVYNYDGPGFMPEFLETGGFARMESRIVTMVPYKSIVGMLLTQVGRLVVIQSESSGVSGHDGFTWDVDRSGFIHCNELSNTSRIFGAAIDEALADRDIDERRELIEEIFDVLGSTGAFTLTDFSEQSLRQTMELAKNFAHASELRSFLFSMIGKSIKTAMT